jgi:hypothetical protein
MVNFKSQWSVSTTMTYIEVGCTRSLNKQRKTQAIDAET